MADVMLEDTRIPELDAGLPAADVILLHALPLQAAMWDEQLRWFGERHRVIAPDLKGFGGSDAPEDPAAYSVESYADDAAGLLSLLDLPRAVVAGATPDAATSEEAAANGEQQHWIRVEGDLHLLINRRVDQLVGRGTSRRAEAVRLARRLMGTNPPAESAGWRR